MKKSMLCLVVLFLVSCDRGILPGQCYQHKITGERGLVINLRQGDSLVPNNEVVVGKTQPEDVCITYEKDALGNNILSNCLEHANLGGYKKEYYVSEVSVISCDGIIKEDKNQK